MKLEKQVVSPELAQKLKELGVKQESLFWYVQYGKTKPYEVKFSKARLADDFISAFTVAELGEMLPVCTWSSEVISTFGKYNCWRFKEGGGVTEKESFYADTEVDARAKMLIYLVENKLITL